MLTKAHIKYLESRLITLARKANTSYLDNSNTPTLTKTHLPIILSLLTHMVSRF